MKTLAPVDESVKIPAAVARAAANANAIHTQAYQTEPAEPPADAPAEPAPVTPPAAATPVEPAPVTPAPDAPVEPINWEHRYNSMKGRFEQSQSQVRELSQQIGDLQRSITTIQARQSTSPPPAPKPKARLVTPEEENDYGAELLTVVGKRAQEELDPIVSDLKGQIAGLEQQIKSLGGYVSEDSQQRMFGVMDSKLSNWREINRDQSFIDWLALPDPFSGAIRHEMLKAAFERHDAPRVLAFFNGFLSQEAARAPRDELVPTGDVPPASAAAPMVQLQDLAAPGRARTAAPSVPAEKPTFTRAQVTQFYNDVRAGKYRGKEAEKDKVEAAIFAATADGRLLN